MVAAINAPRPYSSIVSLPKIAHQAPHNTANSMALTKIAHQATPHQINGNAARPTTKPENQKLSKPNNQSQYVVNAPPVGRIARISIHNPNQVNGKRNAKYV